VGATFAAMLGLKLAAFACGPPLLRSPSGHTAAAAIVLGGLVVVLGGGRRRTVLLAASLGGGLIGISRLTLGVHTPWEVALGGLVGTAGALALWRLAGPPPRRLRLGWLVAVVVGVGVVFHGWHLDAEPWIHRAALDAAGALHVCRAR
jgi:membrane-associated phospholipid phosphatase